MKLALTVSLIVMSLNLSCAGVPKRISAARYCELASLPVGSAVDSTEIGIISGPSGRAYIEVWSALPFYPDLRVYYVPLADFASPGAAPCDPKG